MLNHLRMASLLAAALGLAFAIQPLYAFTEGACKEDAQKFCADVKPGGGSIMDCMKSHQADLSQACKDNIAEGKADAKSKMDAMKTACQADIKQFCASVTPGQGREIACLKSYDDKISAACKEQLPKRMMRRGMKHGQDHGAPPPQDGGNSNAPGDDAPPPPAK